MTAALAYAFHGFAKSSQRRETAPERKTRIGMRWMLVTSIGLMGLVILGNLRVIGYGELLQMAVYSTPLLTCVGSVFLMHRYVFFDLFIKRGLSLLLTLLVLTAYFSLVLPGLAPFNFGWARPWVYALVALALPALFRRLEAWIDRVWLSRRFTTVEAVKQFLSSMQRATSEQQLVEQAEQM